MGKGIEVVDPKAFSGREKGSLKEITVRFTRPFEPTDWGFDERDFRDAVIKLPAGTRDMFARTAWSKFKGLEEDDFYAAYAGANAIPVDAVDADGFAFVGRDRLMNLRCVFEMPFECDLGLTDYRMYITRLYVPKGRMDAFLAVTPWGKFRNLGEIDYITTGTEDVTTPDESISEIYTLNGQRFYVDAASLPGGTYIIKRGGKYSKMKI